MGLRVAALERLEQLYRGQPYETGMMQAILIGETFQLEKVWTEHFRRTGTVPRAGDLRHARGGAGGVLPVPAAALLRAARRGGAADRGGGLALRAGDRLAGARACARPPASRSS